MISGILRNTFVALSMGALLTACGGGGSSSNSSSDPATIPAGTTTPGTGGNTDPTTPAPSESVTPDAGDDSAPVTTPPENDATPPAEETDPSEPVPPPVTPVTKSAILTWDAPTTRTDGSCLSDLKSYRISYGLAPGVYPNTEILDVADTACTDSGTTTACGKVVTCSYMVDQLDSASWYFAVQAVDEAGNVSSHSNEAIKTIQ